LGRCAAHALQRRRRVRPDLRSLTDWKNWPAAVFRTSASCRRQKVRLLPAALCHGLSRCQLCVVIASANVNASACRRFCAACAVLKWPMSSSVRYHTVAPPLLTANRRAPNLPLFHGATRLSLIPTISRTGG